MKWWQPKEPASTMASCVAAVTRRAGQAMRHEAINEEAMKPTLPAQRLGGASDSGALLARTERALPENYISFKEVFGDLPRCLNDPDEPRRMMLAYIRDRLGLDPDKYVLQEALHLYGWYLVRRDDCTEVIEVDG